MTADHVAQQRAQVVGDLFGEHPRAGAGRGRCPRSRPARARSPAPRARSRLKPALRGRAERSQAPGKHAARGPLGLEHRPQRKEVVAERLEEVRALAAHLEAPQRPGELVAVGRATRDEVAERAQLVLLLDRHDQHPVGTPAGADGQRRPGTGADPRPAQRRERDAPVAEQPQRAQQVAEHVAAPLGGALRVGLGAGERDDQVARLGAVARRVPRAEGRRAPGAWRSSGRRRAAARRS